MSCSFKNKLICCLSLFLLNPVLANEIESLKYDARLCSAQLLVIDGDSKRLQNTATKQHHKTGLKQRISSALGTLSWLCKRYVYVNGMNDFQYEKVIENIRTSYKAKDWPMFNKNMDYLMLKMPLKIEAFDLQQVSRETLNTSKSIYLHYCKACHHQPNQDSETPAYSLFDMAKKISLKEFLARMLVGIHGTPEIALRNPLSNDDIAGMTHYFLNTYKATY